ncbi:MAG: hypothetical protein ACYCVA_03980 [Sulfobacillus sp.]
MELLALVAGWALTRLLAPWQRLHLARWGWLRNNFLGQPVVVGAGLLVAAGGALLALITGWLGAGRGPIVALTVVTFAILGALDDRLGDRSAGGFHGHLRALWHGQVTTGAVKALGGGVVALLVAWWWGGSILVVVGHALLIALSANAINLLDLRPGRALKVAIPLLVASTLTSGASWAGFTGGAIALLPEDLAGSAMLGDTGANALGAAAGLGILGFDVAWQAILLIALVGLHLYTERHSLSDLINRHRWLTAIDQWGRQGRVL